MPGTLRLPGAGGGGPGRLCFLGRIPQLARLSAHFYLLWKLILSKFTER
jgi:hypothetical protein